MNDSSVTRCPWVGDHPLYQAYHDEEWGVPIYDSQALFAKLCLDGAQAGLSWLTILKKREGYYRAFDQFDPERIAHYDEAKIAALRQDAGIVRNRLKIEAVVKNARGYRQITAERGSFAQFLWAFVDHRPIQHTLYTLADYPTQSAESLAMSTALRSYGFNFVGPTICYAFMQAVGMVNDHTQTCFRCHALTL